MEKPARKIWSDAARLARHTANPPVESAANVPPSIVREPVAARTMRDRRYRLTRRQLLGHRATRDKRTVETDTTRPRSRFRTCLSAPERVGSVKNPRSTIVTAGGPRPSLSACRALAFTAHSSQDSKSSGNLGVGDDPSTRILRVRSGRTTSAASALTMIQGVTNASQR